MGFFGAADGRLQEAGAQPLAEILVAAAEHFRVGCKHTGDNAATTKITAPTGRDGTRSQATSLSRSRVPYKVPQNSGGYTGCHIRAAPMYIGQQPGGRYATALTTCPGAPCAD